MAPLWLSACALLACKHHTELPTTTLQLNALTLTVELADDPDERHLGLMHRKSLPQDHGMLFVYPGEAPRSFWMENTPLPLSIAYLDEDGVILNVEDMTPMSREGVPSSGPAMYALEVNRGWFEQNGVKPGDRVQGLPGPAVR